MLLWRSILASFFCFFFLPASLTRWPETSTSGTFKVHQVNGKQEPKIGFDKMVSPLFSELKNPVHSSKTVKLALNLYRDLNLNPFLLPPPSLHRRWRSWVWMSGRTSVGLVPGRIPRNTRSSSAPHRTRQSEVQGGRVEQAGHTIAARSGAMDKCGWSLWQRCCWDTVSPRCWHVRTWTQLVWFLLVLGVLLWTRAD